MREILFRGKLKSTSEWAYGNLNVKTKGVCIITPDDTPIGKYGQVDPETVGQYTGLTDKNGKKIFEGDIVKTERDLWHGENKKQREVFVSVVRYDKKQCSFGLYGKYKFLTLRRFKGDFNEVIGNIHDNPELLKGGENG